MSIKDQWATATAGTQGLRTNAAFVMGCNSLIQTLGGKRPSNFLFNTNHDSSSVATLQEPSGTNYRMAITKFLWDTRIQNRSNAHMELKIYECVIRHNTPSSALSDSGATAAIQTLFSDAVDVGGYVGQTESNLGPGQAAYPTGVSHGWQHPAFTPFNSNEFVSTFKIQKIHSRILGPNEILPMKFYLRRKFLRGSHIHGPNAEWQRGFTKLLLFSWVGQMIDDNSLTAQTKAKCDLFVQVEQKVDYHFLPGSEPLVNYAWGATSAHEYGGATQNYKFDPSTAGMKIPAEGIVETVAGSDEVDPHVP